MFLQNVSSYYSQHSEDVCFRQFMFEISTAFKAVKVHILFVNLTFPSQLLFLQRLCRLTADLATNMK
jgi:hypothetical protein